MILLIYQIREIYRKVVTALAAVVELATWCSSGKFYSMKTLGGLLDLSLNPFASAPLT